MTPALLRSLRETPGCGKHRIEEIGIGTVWCRDCGRQNPSEDEPCHRHEFAITSGLVCDDCLSLLADKVLTLAVERLPVVSQNGDLALLAEIRGVAINKNILEEALRAALRGDG